MGDSATTAVLVRSGGMYAHTVHCLSVQCGTVIALTRMRLDDLEARRLYDD